MESTPAKTILKALLICNDDYDPELTDHQSLKFNPLPGCRKDIREVRKMLDESNFDTAKFHPTTSKNDNKDTLSDKLGDFRVEVMEANRNNPVVAFVYYTGHGAMNHEDPNQNTLIVHKEPHDYTNITSWIYKLAIQRNTQVFAILDCCRTYLPKEKGGPILSEAKPAKGCFFIGFGAKIGKPSIQSDQLSQFTGDFLEAVAKKQVSLPGDIMMSKFLGYGAMDSNSQRNFTLDTTGNSKQESESSDSTEVRVIKMNWMAGEDPKLKDAEILYSDQLLLSEVRQKIFAQFKGRGLSQDFVFISQAGKPISEKQEKKKQLQFIITEDDEENASIQIHTKPEVSKPNQQSRVVKTTNGFDTRLYSKQPTSQQRRIAKVLIVLGGTGSGKSTLLNTLVCYCLGVKKTDRFRYVIVDDTGKDQTKSVTNDVTEYYVEESDRSPPLLIIDTPGFGDTRGVSQDHIIFEKIKKLFNDNVENLHAVCFVGKSPTPRLDPPQEYILQNIVKLFGLDVADNFVTMATFCDGGSVLIKAALESSEHFERIKKAKGGHKIFNFNNSAMFVDPETDEIAPELHDQFWRMGMSSMERFVESFLKTIMPVSLRQTRQNLLKRQTIEEHVIAIKNNQKIIALQKNEIEELIKLFQQHEREINDNKGFTYEEIMWKSQEVTAPNGQLVTQCVKCLKTCHENCKFDNGDKWRCYLFTIDNSGEYTTEEEALPCSGCGCELNHHSNTGTIWKQVSYVKTVTLTQKKGAYDKANKGKTYSETLIAKKQQELQKLRARDSLAHREIIESMQVLESIALKKDVYNTKDYYDTQIAIEKEKPQTEQIRKNIAELEQAKANDQELAKACSFKMKSTEMKAILQSVEDTGGDQVKIQQLGARMAKAGQKGVLDTMLGWFGF